MTYLRYSWAVNGDRDVIPDDATADGSTSYQEGWGVRTTLDPATNTNALSLSRRNFNGLFFAITAAIRELQQQGHPDRIDSADNGGITFPYTTGARLHDSGNVYESLVDNNTSPLSNQSAWRRIDVAATDNRITKNISVLTTVARGSTATRINLSVPDDSFSQTGLTDSLRVFFRNPVITGANVTVNLSGTGAKRLTNTRGQTPTGILRAGELVEIAYAQTSDTWILMSATDVSDATTTTAGLVRRATQSEAAADFDGNVFLSPSDLARLFEDRNVTGGQHSSGYQILPGSLIFQWRNVVWDNDPAASGTLNWPVAFPANVIGVVWGFSASRGGGGSLDYYHARNVNRTSFTYVIRGRGNFTILAFGV